MAILLSKNIAQCDDRARPRGTTTARRDDRAAVGWAWTGRNLILDEALATAYTRPAASSTVAVVGASTIVGLMPSSQITTLRVEMQVYSGWVNCYQSVF